MKALVREPAQGPRLPQLQTKGTFFARTQVSFAFKTLKDSMRCALLHFVRFVTSRSSSFLLLVVMLGATSSNANALS